MKFQEAISKFGLEAKSKLSNPGAGGAPEDQLRAPLEALIANLAELIVGEARIVERAFGLGPCALTEAMALLQDRLASAET